MVCATINGCLNVVFLLLLTLSGKIKYPLGVKSPSKSECKGTNGSRPSRKRPVVGPRSLARLTLDGQLYHFFVIHRQYDAETSYYLWRCLSFRIFSERIYIQSVSAEPLTDLRLITLNYIASALSTSLFSFNKQHYTVFCSSDGIRNGTHHPTRKSYVGSAA